MEITKLIKDLKSVSSLSKHEQLVMGIIQAIDNSHLVIGSQLPSINVMVDELGFARKTIVKAYEELKERGLIESKKTKGYFIVSTETKQMVRIALLLYSFQRFQQEFYNTLRDELGEKVQIDVFFHHNNEEVFETIFSNIRAKYGMYVVAPIQSNRAKMLLSSISPDKLIIVDRFIDIGVGYTYITQEFKNSTITALNSLLPSIKKYDGLTLYFREDQDYPTEILASFNDFILNNGLNGRVEKKYLRNSVQDKWLYLFINDSDLWGLIKDSKNNDFRIGRNVGVLSFNDHVVKEIVVGGITTVSTDFNEMAIVTAKNILELQLNKVIIPTKLIDRQSI